MSEVTEAEKIQLLGEQLIEAVEGITRLAHIVNQINERLEWLEGQPTRYDLKNELTHLHNEVHEIQKHLGLDGSVPKAKRQVKYV